MDLTQLVTSDDEFAEIMEKIIGTGKLVVVHYFIKESSSCAKMEPVFRNMSNKFSDIHFLKVDSNFCKETIKAHRIESMPTFVFYRNMEPLDIIQGAKPLELEIKIRQLMDKNGDMNTEYGFSMGPGGMGDLHHFLDESKCECLNGSDLTPFHSFIKRKSRLESDTDSQLILVYGFNQPVKIKYLKLKAPPENGPSMLKIFSNQIKTLSFDDAEQVLPTQEIVLKPEDLTGENKIELNQTKFQNVQNIHIFIPSSNSYSDLTILDYLSLYGEPMKQTKGIAGKTDQVVYLD